MAHRDARRYGRAGQHAGWHRDIEQFEVLRHCLPAYGHGVDWHAKGGDLRELLVGEADRRVSTVRRNNNGGQRVAASLSEHFDDAGGNRRAVALGHCLGKRVDGSRTVRERVALHRQRETAAIAHGRFEQVSCIDESRFAVSVRHARRVVEHQRNGVFPGTKLLGLQHRLLQYPQNHPEHRALHGTDDGQLPPSRRAASHQQKPGNTRDADRAQRDGHPVGPRAGEDDIAAREDVARVLKQEFEQGRILVLSVRL